MPPEPPDTLPALLTRLAATRGAHPVLITQAETLSYAEFARRTSRMARALLAAGAGKGTRIGLLAPDGQLWMVAFFAALRLGALVTPLSTLCTPPELAHLLRHSDCQFLIAARRFINHDYAATLAAALPALGGAPPGPLRLRDAPFLREIWLDDAEEIGWARPLAACLARADAQSAPDEKLLQAMQDEITPGENAIIVYTSGSTAEPKAVLHRHWALARHSLALAAQFAITEDDRMMPLLPAFWVAGMATMLQVFCVGGTIVYPPSPAIEDALEMIARFGVTRVNAWGDKEAKLIAAASARGLSLARIFELAAPRKIAMYGMTESFSPHSAHPLDQKLPAGKEKSFGRAINGYERRVVDPDRNAACPAGEIGELQIRGPALTSGLYKRARCEIFTPDGFYPTRDLVRIDEDGWLYPAGRRDDMIKTRGANVSRLEVEAALQALPGVAAAVAAGLPDPEYGRVVVAAIVPAAGAMLDEAGLKAALRATLSSYKIPRRIVFVAAGEIPRTATGKLALSRVATMIAEKSQAPDPPGP